MLLLQVGVVCCLLVVVVRSVSWVGCFFKMKADVCCICCALLLFVVAVGVACCLLC